MKRSRFRLDFHLELVGQLHVVPSNRLSSSLVGVLILQSEMADITSSCTQIADRPRPVRHATLCDGRSNVPPKLLGLW